MRLGLWLAVVCLGTLLAAPASAASQCGNQKDDCQCGANNPYPCCDNGSNCTWWAWKAACCNWGTGLPGWGNAKTWAQYASNNSKYQVLGSPVPGSIGVSTKGTYGHVVWVESVSGGTISVSEMNCCPGCPYGMIKKKYNASYFNGGFIVKKGQPPPGPVCGNGKCEGGETCANCGDCGSCCGNGACDYGENCGSCSKDCGSCCGNGVCDGGEHCQSCEKDCGKCCGNGQCDFGETCVSCSKDCVCPPEGKLEAANCQEIRGWTHDPGNMSLAVPVDLKVDGQLVGSQSANLPHPSQGPHGFGWPTGPQWRDSKPHTVQVLAHDDVSPAITTLGPKAFLCANHQSWDGIWQSRRLDAAGMEVVLPKLDPPWLAIRHDHPVGYPYPLSGMLESCVAPAAGGFDEAIGSASWHLSAGPWKVRLLVDGTVHRVWTGDGSEPVLPLPGASQVCLRTEAQELAEVPGAADVTLGPMKFRKGPWWLAPSWDSTGWQVAVSGEDAVAVQARPSATVGRGGVRVWHDTLEPFDTIVYRYERGSLPDGVQLTVLAGDSLLPAQVGSHAVTVPPTQRFGAQVVTQAEVALSPGAEALLADVRVQQHGALQDGPWTLERLGSFGLKAAVPPEGLPSAAGLSLVLRHQPAGWWATGAVRAQLRWDGPPIERLRAHLRQDLPEGLRVEVRVDGEPAWIGTTAGKVKQFLDFPAHGQELAVVLGVSGERADLPAGEAELVDIQALRQGWWSAPSPRAQGLRDDRLAGGGVRLETVRAWGMQGKTTRGVIQAVRTFARPQTGLRLKYRQSLDGAAVRVVVLLDGEPVRVLDDTGEAEETLELTDTPFTSLAVALAAKGEGGVFPHRWFAEFRDVTVRGPDGTWKPVDGEPAGLGPGPDAGSLGDAVGGDPAGAPASGCQAGNRGSAGSFWLLAVAIAAWAGRRRRLASRSLHFFTTLARAR